MKKRKVDLVELPAKFAGEIDFPALHGRSQKSGPMVSR